jgi:hypothetical protein
MYRSFSMLLQLCVQEDNRIQNDEIMLKVDAHRLQFASFFIKIYQEKIISIFTCY